MEHKKRGKKENQKPKIKALIFDVGGVLRLGKKPFYIIKNPFYYIESG